MIFYRTLAVFILSFFLSGTFGVFCQEPGPEAIPDVAPDAIPEPAPEPSPEIPPTPTPTPPSEGYIKKILEDEIQDSVSDKFRRGRYLIYDCLEGHYACVDKRGFADCQFSREIIKGRGKRWVLCAPLKKYDKDVDCIAVQKKKITTAHRRTFCIRQN